MANLSKGKRIAARNQPQFKFEVSLPHDYYSRNDATYFDYKRFGLDSSLGGGVETRISVHN